MSVLEKLLDVRNSLEGKALAVFMSIVLVFTFTNFSAYAADEAAESDDVAAASAQAEQADIQASADEGSTASADERNATGEQPDSSGDSSAVTNPSEPEAGEAGSVAESDVATVKLDLQNAYLIFLDQTIAVPAKTFDVPVHKELDLQVFADEGYEIASVKAVVDGNETTVEKNGGGRYIFDAALVTSALTIAVETKAVKTAEEGSDEIGESAAGNAADPITSDTVIAPGNEGQTHGEQPETTEPAETVDVIADVSSPAFEGYAYIDGIIVKVTAGEGVLPEGTTVQASKVERTDVIEAVSETVESQGKVLQDSVAIDVTLLDEGGDAIQPEAPVNVCFFDANLEGDEVGVYRVSDDASNVEAIGARQADAAVQSFDVDHFTIYVAAGVGAQQAERKAEVYETIAIGESVTFSGKSDDGSPYAETRENEWSVTPESQNVITTSDASQNELTVVGESAGSVTLRHTYQYRVSEASPWISATDVMHISVVESLEAQIALYDELNNETSGGTKVIASGSLLADDQGNVAPAIDGYYFLDATVDGVVIAYAEQRFDGVYYSVEGDLSSGVGIMLDKGENIVLRYRELGNKVPVRYTTSGYDGVTGNEVVGFPGTVETGGDMSFRVSLARGYESEVTIGDTTLAPDSGNTYTVKRVSEDTTVHIEFRKKGEVSFDTTWWNTTANTRGRYTMIEPAINKGSTILTKPVGDDGASFAFEFRTTLDQTWQLNSFNINGLYLSLPDRTKGSSAKTVLYSDASGECTATVTVVDAKVSGNTQYRYRIDIAGAKEDLRIEFANLNSVTWREVMPTADEGIVFEPVNGEVPVLNKPWQTKGETPTFKFHLAEGYKNLQVRMRMLASSGVELFNETIALPEDGSSTQISYDGKKRATISRDGDTYTLIYTSTTDWNTAGVTLQHLQVVCEKITYGIEYSVGAGSGMVSDNAVYDSLGNSSTVVVGQIPVAPYGKFFKGWRLQGDDSGALYYVGDKIDFTDAGIQNLLQQGDGSNDGKLVFEAQYASELIPGEAVSVPVEVYLLGESGRYELDADKSFSAKGAMGKTISYLNLPVYEGYSFEHALSTTSVKVDGENGIKLFYSRQFNADVALADWTYNGSFDAAGTLRSSVSGGDYADPTYYYKLEGEADDAYSVDAPVDAGSYVVKAVWAATENCGETSATDSFTIDPAPLSVTTVGKTKVYDGEPLTEAGNSVAGLVAGETLGVTNTGSITDVGSADNGYELEWAGGENGYTAKRSNYALGEPTLGRLVVTPAAATVYVNSSSKRFNDSDPEFAGSVSGLVGTDSLGDITYSRTNDAEEVGVYEGVLTATVKNANGNYTYEVVNGDFTIERAEGNIVRIDADGLTKTYDGLGASINAHAEIDGSTLLYSADGETWSPDNPSYTDAGTYTVYAMATNDSYEDTGVVSATIIVNPAQVIVTADDQSKITGTDDPALTYVSTDGVNGEVPGFTGALERVQGETVGSYAINQGSLAMADNGAFKASNYALRFVAGTLSITATTPVPLPTPTPTPPTDTPAPVPTPGVLPADDPIAPVVDALQNIVETVIPNDEIPLEGPTESTIEDDETPLATFDYVHCWVHYYLILGIILTVLYGVGVLVRRIRFTGKLKACEDDVLGIEDETTSFPVTAPVVTEGKGA